VSAAEQNILTMHGVTIDRYGRRAFAGDIVLSLTPAEFRLLEAFLAEPGRAFSRSELISAALGDVLVEERTIDVHVRALRKKLGDHAGLIETVRGFGYRFKDDTEQ